MTSWTIRQRLIFLVGCFLANIVLVQLVAKWTGSKLERALDRTSQVYLPAVRLVGEADMVHHGVWAVTSRAIVVGSDGSAAERLAIETQYRQMKETILGAIEGLQNLNLSEETRAAVRASEPIINHYVTVAGDVIRIALAGDRARAMRESEKVQEAFESVETALTTFAHSVQSGADQAVQDSKGAEALGHWVSWTVLLASLILGVLNAWWSIADISRLLNSVIGRLREESQKLVLTSQDVSRTSASVSTSTTHQSEALQKTAASIEEMSSMIKRTAENADQSRDVARRAEHESQRGQQTVQELIHAIREISGSNDAIGHKTEESNRQISEIVKVIEEIGAKTRVINDIVFQTKLLSFNASVEAARAGEHGKGFAVVAEEVGNLAQMSGNAAKEISDMLGSSTQHVQDIVTKTKSEIERLMTQNKGKVEAGTRVAKDCGDVLTELSHGVIEVSKRVDEISTATREQATGVSEITKAMNSLDQVTHANSSASRQGSASAEELAHEADNLLIAVQELERLVGGGSSPHPSSSVEREAPKPISLKKITTIDSGLAEDSTQLADLKRPHRA